MIITIVGLGLIGGSLGLDLRARGYATRVLGVDSRPENAAMALKLGLVDEVRSLDAAVADSDLVILAIPVNAIAAFLPRVLDLLPEGASATDMGSTKQGICQVVKDHAKRAQFVASHPMAGTENSGPSAALTGLFDGKAAVICDGAASGEEHRKRVEAMYLCLGMRLIAMSSADHDLHAAYVSHLSHISSFVLAGTVLAEEKNSTAIFDLAGGGFESTVRLAKSSPDMWAPILEQNRENVLQALEAYIGQLQAFQGALVAGRLDETRRLMEDANRIRPVLANLGAKRRG